MTIAIHNADRNSVISFFAEPQKRSLLERSLDVAFAEDLAGRLHVDATTEAVVGDNVVANAALYLKRDRSVIAGLKVLELVFKRFDPDSTVTYLIDEGDFVATSPLLIAQVKAKAKAMLTAERTALNLLQRMSGIASLTRLFVQAAEPFGITILDTRKTTPGLRVFERYAVAVGGGTNHRFGLSDGIIIKDNHLAVAGGIKNAVTAVRAKYPTEAVEVECTSLAEVAEAFLVGVDTIMLDNMSPSMVREAIGLVKGTAKIEVSGGINLLNLKEYLLPGVDCISVGALTHSAGNVDISLEVESYS